MRYLKNSKIIFYIALLVSIIYFIRSDFVAEYLDRSSINDNPAILLEVYDDNAISIGGVMFDKSKETKSKKNDGRWHLKGNRKLTDEELFCLKNGIFASVIINGYVDIMCNYEEKIMYIN